MYIKVLICVQLNCLPTVKTISSSDKVLAKCRQCRICCARVLTIVAGAPFKICRWMPQSHLSV